MQTSGSALLLQTVFRLLRAISERFVMESLIKNEQLPATSNPPVVTNTVPPTVVELPPAYQPNNVVPPQQIVVVRDTYNQTPPGVTAKAIISIVGSVIVFFCSYVTIFCAVPSIIFATLALSSSNEQNQRKTYANVAIGLFLAALLTMVIVVVIVVVLLVGSNPYDY